MTETAEKTTDLTILPDPDSAEVGLVEVAVGRIGEDKTTALTAADDRFGGLIYKKVEKHTLKAIVMADAVSQIREALEPIAETVLKPLSGSAIGFRTDKQYDLKVVVACVTHAMMLGLRPVGNEFNIIAGNMYPAKDGLKRLVRERVELEVVDMDLTDVGRHSGTHAKCLIKVRYRPHGEAGEWDTLERPYYVRCGKNDYDQAEGKLMRKMYRDVLEALTGAQVPEPADVDDGRQVKQAGSSSTTSATAAIAASSEAAPAKVKTGSLTGKVMTSALVQRLRGHCEEIGLDVGFLEEAYGQPLHEITFDDLNPMETFTRLREEADAFRAEQTAGGD